LFVESKFFALFEEEAPIPIHNSWDVDDQAIIVASESLEDLLATSSSPFCFKHNPLTSFPRVFKCEFIWLARSWANLVVSLNL